LLDSVIFPSAALVDPLVKTKKDAANVWMVKRGEQFSSTLETVHAIGFAGELIGQDLDRHVAF
jgi:hypothetical protein